MSEKGDGEDHDRREEVPTLQEIVEPELARRPEGPPNLDLFDDAPSDPDLDPVGALAAALESESDALADRLVDDLLPLLRRRVRKLLREHSGELAQTLLNHRNRNDK